MQLQRLWKGWYNFLQEDNLTRFRTKILRREKRGKIKLAGLFKKIEDLPNPKVFWIDLDKRKPVALCERKDLS